MREAFCCFGRRTFPRPPISMLGAPPPKIVPARTKVWRNGTRLAGDPNIEIGGRGSAPSQPDQRKFRKSPNTSVQFVSPNFVLLPYLQRRLEKDSELTITRLDGQACISRSARGAVWGVLTCLFVLSRYKGPRIFFACGALGIP